MNPAQIVITGCNGQLGRALRARHPGAVAVDIGELDIADARAVEAFDWSAVRLVLNAAGYTNVNGAETAEGRAIAWSVNAHAVANLARVAQSAVYRQPKVRYSIMSDPCSRRMVSCRSGS